MPNPRHSDSSYLADSQALYDSAPSEYDRVYFDPITGGFILLHANHNRQNLASERVVAEALVHQGRRVYL